MRKVDKLGESTNLNNNTKKETIFWTHATTDEVEHATEINVTLEVCILMLEWV